MKALIESLYLTCSFTSITIRFRITFTGQVCGNKQWIWVQFHHTTANLLIDHFKANTAETKCISYQHTQNYKNEQIWHRNNDKLEQRLYEVEKCFNARPLEAWGGYFMIWGQRQRIPSLLWAAVRPTRATENLSRREILGQWHFEPASEESTKTASL